MTDFKSKNKVLYFPYINIPYNNWLKKTLLYWDEIGTIVPMDFINYPEKMTFEMQELVKAGLVKQIIPNSYTSDSNYKFSESFINLIKSSNIESKNLDFKEGSKLHIDKFGYEIATFLTEIGLAKSLEHPWYLVESHTANLFMSYLASFLGNHSEINMQPITDSVSILSTFNSSMNSTCNTIINQNVRQEILSNVLPFPSNPITITQLSKFKRKNSDLLLKFRNYIETEIIRISFISCPEEKKFEISTIRNEIIESIEEISARMREYKFGTINFGTIAGLTAAGIPFVDALLQKDEISIAQSLPGLLAALYSSFGNNKKDFLSSPLAYAAFFNNEFK